MTQNLNEAIETLYRVFSKYSSRKTMDYSSQTVAQEEVDVLFAQPLREVAAEHIGYYSSKAMTTMGNVEDFKHFLPRIMELMSAGDYSRDEEMVLEKFWYSEFAEWDPVEREAVESFLFAWWESLVERERCRNLSTLLTELAVLTGDLQKLLSSWDVNYSYESCNNLAGYVVDNHHLIFVDKSIPTFHKRTDEEHNRLYRGLRSWLLSPAVITKLEDSTYMFTEEGLPEKVKIIQEAHKMLCWEKELELLGM